MSKKQIATEQNKKSDKLEYLLEELEKVGCKFDELLKQLDRVKKASNPQPVPEE